MERKRHRLGRRRRQERIRKRRRAAAAAIASAMASGAGPVVTCVDAPPETVATSTGSGGGGGGGGGGESELNQSYSEARSEAPSVDRHAAPPDRPPAFKSPRQVVEHHHHHHYHHHVVENQETLRRLFVEQEGSRRRIAAMPTIPPVRKAATVGPPREVDHGNVPRLDTDMPTVDLSGLILLAGTAAFPEEGALGPAPVVARSRPVDHALRIEDGGDDGGGGGDDKGWESPPWGLRPELLRDVGHPVTPTGGPGETGGGALALSFDTPVTLPHLGNVSNAGLLEVSPVAFGGERGDARGSVGASLSDLLPIGLTTPPPAPQFAQAAGPGGVASPAHDDARFDMRDIGNFDLLPSRIQQDQGGPP